MSNDNLDFLEDDFGLEAEADRTLDTPPELLTLKLLREAIQAQNPDDAVMQDFAEYVLPNLLRMAIGVTAKGGKFSEELDRKNDELNKKNEAEGKARVQRRRDNAADQSLNTHLLNGLFPANLIARRLEKMDTTVKRQVGDRERRLMISGFVLHDFEKFQYSHFSSLPLKYQKLQDDPDMKLRDLSVDDHRIIIKAMVVDLGIDFFVDSDNLATCQEYIDDLLVLAYNAQRRWGTNWNFSVYGLQPILNDRKLGCLADLTWLADLFASVVKHPYDAERQNLDEVVGKSSNRQLKLTYHSIAENRGVLTNVVNNALVDAHTALNTDDVAYYEPLLYLPTGVIYLARRDAPLVDRTGLPDRVVASIKKLCQGQLRQRQTGFGRDGKGMKYADYYNLFFDDVELMRVALDATLRILRTGKSSVATSRSENLVRFQQQGVLPPDYDFKFSDDLRIDQIAEFGDVISRKIWGDRLDRIEALRKQNKKLAVSPSLELIRKDELINKVAEFLGLTSYLPQIREIQRINESLKDLKLKGNTGGVPYEWYFLAAKYLEHNPGIEDVRESCGLVIAHIAKLIQPVIDQYPVPDRWWDDVKEWCDRVIMLPGETRSVDDDAPADIFLKELANYNNAKKSGRGKQLICSISHSAYTVTEQMESAVLFTPQVYTNKQMLGGSNAKRNISSISGIEMMLRQILMNQTQAVGKRFEDGKYRYLYFYPTYYFTPETNKFLQRAYSGIVQTRFDTSIRNHFISRDLDVDLTRDNYQSVDAFLIDDDLERKTALDEKDPEFRRDRTFKLTYPDDQPLTFYFMAIPPERPPGKDSDKKITDTASWIMPAWLALAFPMILDVKTVVSESPIPPFNDGAEFEESVFLDSAPQAIRILLGKDRFRLDHILEGWEDSGGSARSSPLNTLTAAYAIHLDVNAKQGKTGYDANWGKLTELAKDLDTSPLYIFAYLAKWARSQKDEIGSPQKRKLYAHHFYPCFDPYIQFDQTLEQFTVIDPDKSPMNHPKNLTELYRRFYRANKRFNPKANAVLKPLDSAAGTLLKADLNAFQGETLVMAVAAEVFKLMDRVHSSTAEGRWVLKNREEERQVVLEFARYFVVEVFEKSFAGDRARLDGKQLNLLKNTCEFLYRLEDDKENQQDKEKKAEAEAEAKAEQEAT
ncbi:MAG: type CRISPR-associated protein Cas10d/Csc3 [Cyanobacteriota bacterium]|jgi:CRISPR-associated protein Csc3